MEIVNPVKCARATSISEVRDVCLGKEICDIRCRINDWTSNNPYCIGNIGASNIRLEEGSMNLSAIEDFSRFGIECTDPIL